jgi:hypothetical protein
MLNPVQALIQRPIKAIFPIVRAKPATLWRVLVFGFGEAFEIWGSSHTPPRISSRAKIDETLSNPGLGRFLGRLSRLTGKYPRNSPQSEHLRLSSPGFSPAPALKFSLPQRGQKLW